jgi:hypothetical protein
MLNRSTLKSNFVWKFPFHLTDFWQVSVPQPSIQHNPYAYADCQTTPRVVPCPESGPQFLLSSVKHTLPTLLTALFSDRSHGSAVGIATGDGTDDRGVRVRVPLGTRTSFSPRPPSSWGTTASNERENGDLSPGVKWPRPEADHSPSTDAEVKKTWIYTSTSP